MVGSGQYVSVSNHWGGYTGNEFVNGGKMEKMSERKLYTSEQGFQRWLSKKVRVMISYRTTEVIVRPVQ